MSIFNYKYDDEILLYYCDADIDLYNILKCINRYYYDLISTNDNYKSWISLLDYCENLSIVEILKIICLYMLVEQEIW